MRNNHSVPGFSVHVAVLGLAALITASNLLVPPSAGAVNTLAGTSGAAFMKLGQGSARAMGMGRAFVALAEGSDSMMWNPAGLAVTQQKEAVYSYLTFVQQVTSPLYLAYAHPMGRTVWGANVAYISVDGFDARDDIGAPLDNDNLLVRNGFASIGMARSFWYEKLFLGGAMRVIHEDIAGNIYDTAVGDIGAQLKPNSMVSLGLAVQNFGASKANVAQIVRGRAAVRAAEFLTVAMEVAKASDDRARLGLGMEFLLPEEYLDVGQVTFRVGYYNTDNMGRATDQAAWIETFRLTGQWAHFRFGLFTSRAFGYGLGLDYALVPSGSLGTVNQFSVKLKF